MPRERLIVLKLGGSVLTTEADLPRAVHEVYRWVRDGYRVVAVVSALGGTTDRLLAQARRWSPSPDPDALAALLATGERTAASLLAFALDRAGLPAAALDPVQIALDVDGPALDAEPFSLDAGAIRSALEDRPVAVVPGFFGLRAAGAAALLGRGGSDLTALFIAHRLGARCRLVKDVAGLYERDPAGPGPAPRWFRAISWQSALDLDGRIVQHKAVRFARDARLDFEVAGVNREAGTLVGPGPDEPARAPDAPAPLRVGLLGLGVVGGGVYEALGRLGDHFTVTGIAVRDPEKHRRRGVPRRLLTTDPLRVVAGCDLLIEALPGSAPAHQWLAAALRSGRHAVTANKVVALDHGAALERLARQAGVEFRCSAAVGGSAPILETLAALGDSVQSVEGVLNGTSNFVLDRLAEGASLGDAVHAAQAAGFAELDPTDDLAGIDAARKLCVIARVALGIELTLADVRRRGIDETTRDAVAASAQSEQTVRLVASLHRRGGAAEASVRLEALSPDHPLARVRDEWNRALVRLRDGRTVVITGRGAGRYPTTESVVADALQIVRRQSAPAAAAPRARAAVPVLAQEGAAS